MNDDGLADDGVRTAQTQFPFPIEMRLAGSIGFNVPEIAFVTLGAGGATVFVLRWIEVRAGGRGIGRRAITFFMNMETVFAWLQTGDVGDHLHVIAHFRERHGAGDLTAGFRFQFAGRLGRVLAVRRESERAHHPE